MVMSERMATRLENGLKPSAAAAETPNEGVESLGPSLIRIVLAAGTGAIAGTGAGQTQGNAETGETAAFRLPWLLHWSKYGRKKRNNVFSTLRHHRWQH
jgi:hypothetical protein